MVRKSMTSGSDGVHTQNVFNERTTRKVIYFFNECRLSVIGTKELPILSFKPTMT